MWSTGPYMGQTGTLLLVRVPSSPTPGPMGGGMLRLGHALFRLHEPLQGEGAQWRFSRPTSQLSKERELPCASARVGSPHESSFQGAGPPWRFSRATSHFAKETPCSPRSFATWLAPRAKSAPIGSVWPAPRGQTAKQRALGGRLTVPRAISRRKAVSRLVPSRLGPSHGPNGKRGSAKDASEHT
jgi:hypothetical protein